MTPTFQSFRIFALSRLHAQVLMLILAWTCLSPVVTATTFGPVLGTGTSGSSGFFTVDGGPRFLIFVSLFDAVRAVDSGNLGGDLDYLKGTARVDGIRVLPNWWASCPPSCTAATDTLFDPDPNNPLLRAATLADLKTLLGEASARGLIVDLTFTKESIPNGPGGPITKSRYGAAIVETERQIKDYRNVLFDLQNEFNCQSDLNAGDMQGIRNAVWAEDDASSVVRRVVTASPCFSPSEAGQFSAGQGTYAGGGAFSAVAYHDPRDPDWYTQSAISDDVDAISAGASPVVLPIYYQEPTAWGEGDEDDTTASHFTDAISLAKMEGVAAWTFHQRAGNSLGSSSFQSQLPSGAADVLEDLYAAARAATWSISPGFLESPITPQVTLVKAQHVTELQGRVQALRLRFGLSQYAFTTVTQGLTVAATHVAELRTALSALNDAYTAAGLSTPTYTDNSLSGVTIKRVHITELRDAVVLLERH